MNLNISFKKLSDHHLNQIEVFRTAEMQAWYDTIQRESALLKAYEFTKTTAPYFVWDEIDLMWTEYEEAWGSNGRLITELSRRHARDMRLLMEQIEQCKKHKL
jgi:hypothetical protein